MALTGAAGAGAGAGAGGAAGVGGESAVEGLGPRRDGRGARCRVGCRTRLTRVSSSSRTLPRLLASLSLPPPSLSQSSWPSSSSVCTARSCTRRTRGWRGARVCDAADETGGRGARSREVPRRAERRVSMRSVPCSVAWHSRLPGAVSVDGVRATSLALLAASARAATTAAAAGGRVSGSVKAATGAGGSVGGCGGRGVALPPSSSSSSCSSLPSLLSMSSRMGTGDTLLSAAAAPAGALHGGTAADGGKPSCVMPLSASTRELDTAVTSPPPPPPPSTPPPPPPPPPPRSRERSGAATVAAAQERLVPQGLGAVPTSSDASSDGGGDGGGGGGGGGGGSAARHVTVDPVALVRAGAWVPPCRLLRAAAMVATVAALCFTTPSTSSSSSL